MPARVFSAATSTTNDIVAAGEQALVDLYSGNPKEGLNSLHYKHFCEKVAKRSTIALPQTLPPTSATAKFTAFVYISKYKSGKVMPVKCSQLYGGWRVYDGRLMLKPTDLSLAPHELLKTIRTLTAAA